MFLLSEVKKITCQTFILLINENSLSGEEQIYHNIRQTKAMHEF